LNQDEFQKLVLESLKDIKSDIKSLKTDVKSLKTQVDENTQILKALEHKAAVNKAEIDNISINIAHIQGDLKSVTNIKTVLKENAENILKAI